MADGQIVELDYRNGIPSKRAVQSVLSQVRRWFFMFLDRVEGAGRGGSFFSAWGLRDGSDGL